MRFLKIVVLLALCAGGYFWWTQRNPPIEVNLHGVNYTADPFSFYLTDPEQPESISGGSGLVDPFGGSGISCCAVLPRTWQPGLKLAIHTTHYLKKKPDGSIPEVKEVTHADVPRYVDGKPGELWVLRTASGQVEVVSSDVEPGHPQWPGAVKGWPVPSIEYRRERWGIYRKSAADNVELFINLLNRFEKEPEVCAEEDWAVSKKYDYKSLERFDGPRDPRYLAKLKSDYITGLARSKDELKRILEAKP